VLVEFKKTHVAPMPGTTGLLQLPPSTSEQNTVIV
jgi:hypothetical protein